eukprot:CAMPEP_0170528672 /NCGR_PEP_ID=MMETSP0209-20121228/14175_1 /TAXON_ID=665100 ORGANISM="Litonotus pictus, Strain P1" /NCGR_SAMPLE_ID=MMETSP0209 /ASSEMBLY_ACC=CAM_ASM_000301 /LENGTH=401 /DNA_ID=CAMNT_0010820041 /DNA_START=53 /DNA_END=1258 /DNA_ORIENTATION=+
MKKFIDKHCVQFENKQESSHEQFKLHEEFKSLIETLLAVMLDEAKISESDFLEVAKVGLEKQEDKLYFEQVLHCESYEWFRNTMIRRNIQIQEQSMRLMYGNVKGDLTLTKDSTINKMMIDNNQAELELALQMSLAAEQEKKKLYTEKDEKLGEAIKNAKVEADELGKTIKPVKDNNKKQEETKKETPLAEDTQKAKETPKQQEIITETPTPKPHAPLIKPEHKEDSKNMFLEEKSQEPKKFVKVTKVKENMTKYTPQYITGSSSGKTDKEPEGVFKHKSIVEEGMLSKPEIPKSEVAKDKLKLNKVGLEGKQVNLSGVRSKIDNHLGDLQKESKKFEDDWAKLNDEFSKIDSRMNQGMGDYRQKVIELKNNKRDMEMKDEISQDPNIQKLHSRFSEKKMY